MNLTNLKRMFNHILENIPEEKISMEYYRLNNDFTSHECCSTGCIIGHCVILDHWDNLPKINDDINFEFWSYSFTGIRSHSNIWSWCFSSNWPNDKTQILLRLNFLIDNQKHPNDWDYDYNYLLPIENLEPYELD